MTGIDDRSGQDPRQSPSENPHSLAKQLGQVLRELISKAGKPYSQIAPEVPCGKATIADAVSGDPHRVPSSKIIEGICKACGADEATTKRALDLREALKSKSLAPADPQGTSEADKGPADEQPAAAKSPGKGSPDRG
jgi:hypothetical protein